MSEKKYVRVSSGNRTYTEEELAALFPTLNNWHWRQYKKRIAELEANKSTLQESVTKGSERIGELLERIAELEAQNQAHESYARQVEEQLRIILYFKVTSKARIAELEAAKELQFEIMALKEQTIDDLQARLDAVEDWLLTCSTIGRDARSQLKAILEQKDGRD